jgi:hypothetical protein
MVDGCATTAVASGSPKSRVTRRPPWSLSIGPKLDIATRALKSHEFSDRPTKSRIAGSEDEARRSAARAKSPGTPGVKERANVGCGPNRLDRRQTREIERRLKFRRSGETPARFRPQYRWQRSPASAARVKTRRVCDVTIARERFPHRSSSLSFPCSGPGRASASGSARSRLRFYARHGAPR